VSTNALGSTQFQQNVTLGDGDTGSSFAGSVNYDGLNWSSYDGLTLGNVTTLSSGTVSLNSNGGAIAFSNTVDGTQSLTLIAGSGSISFDASVGDTDPLSSLQITSAANVTFAGTVDANALTQLAGTGTTTFSDTVILSGVLQAIVSQSRAALRLVARLLSRILALSPQPPTAVLFPQTVLYRPEQAAAVLAPTSLRVVI
jgi:hypothetical protein